jgi:hypothetical protein
MSISSRPFASLSELHSNELACLERMAQSGVAAAVLNALQYCQRHQVQIPDWVSISARKQLCEALQQDRPRIRGRSNSPLARLRQDMIDYARWDEVMKVRAKQTELFEETKKLQEAGAPVELLREHERVLAWIGRTLTRAYECASIVLEKSQAFGGPEAMKRSYFKVQRNLKILGQAWRYRLLDRQLLQKLDLLVHIPRQSTKRIVPIYELG